MLRLRRLPEAALRIADRLEFLPGPTIRERGLGRTFAVPSRTVARELEYLGGGDPRGSRHGAFAPRIAASASRLVRVPDAISDAAAAMIEPATVAHHGVRLGRIRLGDFVETGEPLFELCAESAGELAYSRNYLAAHPDIVRIGANE